MGVQEAARPMSAPLVLEKLYVVWPKATVVAKAQNKMRRSLSAVIVVFIGCTVLIRNALAGLGG